MQVCGNGQRVNIDSRYDSPYTKVWKESKRKAYWIEIPYEKAFDVMKTVNDAIKDYGKDNDFWNILGTILESKFIVLDFDYTKKDKIHTTTNKPEKPKQTAQKTGMILNYAKVIYTDKMVTVNLCGNEETNIITFERRRSWSHKKYVDKALEQSGMQPSWDFRYGWEFCGQ
jgi:hypothetical protein